MESDIDVPTRRKCEGTYRVKTRVRIGDKLLSRLVRKVTARPWLILPPYEGGPDKSVLAFADLVRRADRDTVLRLLGHQSPVLRGRLAGHILEARRGEMERLYPLLHDDRPLDTLAGYCVVGWTRVGSYVARELGHIARREKDGGPMVTTAEREVARTMLVRAARDAALPVRVRGAVVEGLVFAKAAEAEPVLRECLACHEPALLHAALSGLAQLPEAERWPVLRALRDHPSVELRAKALEVSAALEDPALAEACERTLRDDPEAMLRRLALLLLPHPSRRSVDAVRSALRDRDRYVAASALTWLIEEDAGAVVPLVCEGISRPDEAFDMGDVGRLLLKRPGSVGEVLARHAVALDGPLAARRRNLIGEALDCVGERRLLDCLAQVRRHLASPDYYVADRAACAAGHLGDHASTDAIEALLAVKGWRAREGAALGLAALGSVRSLPLLRAALEGAVPVTRRVIEGAITRLEESGRAGGGSA